MLREKWNLGEGRSAFDGLLYDGRVSRAGETVRVMLLAPQTYMNNSGRSVRKLLTFYKAEVENVLVVLDDMALPAGMIRSRKGGSAGGHNGLSDILESLGDTQVPRLRVGIGRPAGSRDPVDFVLAPFDDDEKDEMEIAIRKAADAVEDWVFCGITSVMDKYNRRSED